MLIAVQIVGNTLAAGALLALLSASFAVLYRTCRFFHFAHAVSYTAGAFVFFAVARIPAITLPIACFLSLLIAAAVGVFIFAIGSFWPMRRGTSSLVLMLASLGVYIICQNSISLIFGEESKRLAIPAMETVLGIFGVRLSLPQLLAIGVCPALLVLVHVLLGHSRLGCEIRAEGSNRALATAIGLPDMRIMFAAVGISSFMAAVCGLLVGLDVGFRPTMGLPALMNAIVVVLVGGTAIMARTVAYAFLLTAMQQAAVWFLGSEWKEPTAFALLLCVLLLRSRMTPRLHSKEVSG